MRWRWHLDIRTHCMQKRSIQKHQYGHHHKFENTLPVPISSWYLHHQGYGYNHIQSLKVEIRNTLHAPASFRHHHNHRNNHNQSLMRPVELDTTKEMEWIQKKTTMQIRNDLSGKGWHQEEGTRVAAVVQGITTTSSVVMGQKQNARRRWRWRWRREQRRGTSMQKIGREDGMVDRGIGGRWLSIFNGWPTQYHL